MTGQTEFLAADLEDLFGVIFREWRTKLVGGVEEPRYEPGNPGWARLYYTRDYFRSALHETAHWCIAGERRRRLPDFGYWYQPDGRDAAAQRAFLQVEEAPQALEWLFCASCGHSFCVSLDNLSGEGVDSSAFERAVRGRAWRWLEQGGVPPRARLWIEALTRRYRNGVRLEPAHLEAVFMPL